VIIRVFRPRVQPGMHDEFERFLRETAMPFVSSHDGLVAQHIGRPMASSPDEFVYIAVWRDLAALRAFAGEDWTKAVVDPSEEHMLRETSLSHYEALEAS
jgi:heme-degrading monooxygenase HmoA